MAVELNGIAHIQLTVNDPERCIPFWKKLCHFFEMKTLLKGDNVVYCIGSRTGILFAARRRRTEGSGSTRIAPAFITSAFVRGVGRMSTGFIDSSWTSLGRRSSIRPRRNRSSHRVTTPSCLKIQTGSGWK